MSHNWYAPCTCDGRGCMFCDGGLETCKTCGAFEGATPDECPGRQMSANTSDLVYAGQLNYRDGAWFPECAQIMRHVYDLENLMAESGYHPGPSHPISGNPTWEKK